MKDGRLVKKADVPADELERLSKGNVIEQPTKTEQPDKSCLFCGVHSRYSRFVDLQTVYLCDDHYYSENVGKIANKLRSDRSEDAKEDDDA